MKKKMVINLLGGHAGMEKVLGIIGAFGVSLVIVGVLTGCGAIKDEKNSTMQNIASQVEIEQNTSTGNKTVDEVLKDFEVDSEEEALEYIESLEAGSVATESLGAEGDGSIENEDIKVNISFEASYETTDSEKAAHEEIKEQVNKLEQQAKSEAKQYWDTNKEDELAVYIENGLSYEEFEKLYILYRVGLDETMYADDAYRFVVIEVDREYASKAVEDAYAELNGTVHITKNSDGTYTFSDEFIGAITSYSFFDGATEAEINDWLQSQASLFSIADGKTIHSLISGAYGNSKLHKEPQAVVEQSKPSSGNTGNSGNGSNSGGSSTNQGGNNTPVENTPPVEKVEDDGFDSLIPNGDGTLTTSDGTFTMGDGSNFGGGQGEIPEGFTGLY